MEKLERILHAEDSARGVADEAGATAARTIAEARASAADILRSGREATIGAAGARRAEALEDARSEAAEIAAKLFADATSVLESAEAHVDVAIDAVTQAVRGR